MNINKSLKAKRISYGGTRSNASIKYIVLHYTGNKTDTAKANANYFSPHGGNTRKAGAHYFVDKTSVYQSIDDSKIAYSVGGSKYSNCGRTGGGKMYGKITNTNSISIEMCSNGGAIAEETIRNAVALTKMLMAKYHIPASNVYRHFDVTGKDCPAWSGWIGHNTSKWSDFKNRLSTANNHVATATAGWLAKIHNCDSLNIRGGAGTKYPVVGVIGKNEAFTIVEQVGDEHGNKWGLLKSYADKGNGWVSIKYVKAI